MFRAAAIYLVAAWAVIQVADVVLPRLGAPDWLVTFIIILAALGLPVSIVVAWFYDFSNGAPTQSTLSPTTRAAALFGLGVVVTLVAFAAYWRLRPDTSSETQYANSVAVLPFVDMSPNKDQEYFGDGITEEILNALAQLPGLRVPARTSSFSFKGKNVPISEVAKQLNVEHVLEGSIRKAGDAVRITAQLIDAKTDRHVWSQTYDRSVSDIFAVQDEIAHAIANALQIQMGRSESIARNETDSPAAHELYLKGLYHWNRRHDAELPLALDQFKAAVREDPNYARAHAGVALAYAILRQYVDGTDRDVAISEGKAAARRALKLDPRAADAHAALSQIALTMEWDWKAAEAHADTAVMLDPNYATAYQWRSEVYMTTGRYDESIRDADRALELDPLSGIIHQVKASALRCAGREEEAIAIFRTIMRRDPELALPRESMMWITLARRDFDNALVYARGDTGITILVNAMKNPAAAPALLDLLGRDSTRQDIARVDLATAYMLLGEPDSAASMLYQAAEAHDNAAEVFWNDPIYKPIYNHPRFREYVRKLNIPGQ